MCRESVFLFLCLFGDLDSLQIANNLYLNSQNIPIPETLKETVCISINIGNFYDLNSIFQRFTQQLY